MKLSPVKPLGLLLFKKCRLQRGRSQGPLDPDAQENGRQAFHNEQPLQQVLSPFSKAYIFSQSAQTLLPEV